MSSVAVIVLNWNGFEETRRCLSSLAALEYEPLRVVVVDNGSTDGSAERLADLPGIELIRSDRNRGFAGGVNLGVRRALETDAAYVWLLNNDAEVKPSTLAALVDEAEADARIGIVGGVLPEVWGGGRVSEWTGVARPVTEPGELLDYVTGTCMLIRRAVLEQVGLFDEAFFFYYEDADFCRRAQEDGWRLSVAPEARVEHAGGATVNRGADGRSAWADRLQVESSGVFIGKHLGANARLAHGLRLAGIIARRLARGQPGRIPELAKALGEGVRRGQASVS
jgi:GT2 family glycosyltransferase